MKFVGNQKIIARLRKAVASGTPAQAYLFSGPRHVGKFSLAKYFAASLISGDHDIAMDGQFSTQVQMDMILVAPLVEEKKGVSKEKDISIEAIRDAQVGLGMFPHGGKRKVLIIDQAHKMGVGAQNALLKTLEEPNSSSVLILVTDEESHILPTIKSRCQTLTFSLLENGELKTMLPLGRHDEAELLFLSMGRPGMLAELMTKPELVVENSKIVARMKKALDGPVSEKFSLAEELSKDAPRAINSLTLLMWILRQEALEAGSQGSGIGRRYGAISKVYDCIELLKRTNANSRMAIEELFLNI